MSQTIAARPSVAPAWRHGGLLAGGVMLGLVVLAALFAPALSLHDPATQDLLHRRLPPIWHDWLFGGHRAVWTHPLGTDKTGRDYYSRLLYGSRISLLIGIAAVTISGLIGTAMGCLAGYRRGWTDLVVTFAITTRLSMPVVLVALVVVSVYGNTLTILVCTIGLLAWDRFAVVSRGLAMQIAQRDYVISARAIGASVGHIILREILPNLLGPLLVIATLEMANAIMLEAALSFLGLGVPPPAPAWGLLLAEAKEDIFFNAWMILQPGLLLFLTVLGINLLGDGLRDLTADVSR